MLFLVVSSSCISLAQAVGVAAHRNGGSSKRAESAKRSDDGGAGSGLAEWGMHRGAGGGQVDVTEGAGAGLSAGAPHGPDG